MKDKVVMVTGATDGIGLVTARELAGMGAEVIVVGRNAEKGERVVTDIKNTSGNQKVVLMVADLSSMQEVRRLAEEFKSKYKRLDVLVNNAGAVFQRRAESVDGYEMTFALNHLNYFLLTNLLLDTLKASAPARIVNVSSAAHQGQTLDFDDLQNVNNYSGFSVYGQSKLANVLFTKALAKRLEGSGVSTNVLHPGFVATQFGRNNSGLMRLFMPIAHLFARNPDQGAETSVYLASSPEVEDISGEYFADSDIAPSSTVSKNADAAERLWKISAEMVGL